MGKNEKLLASTIDRNLNFDDHAFTLCKKDGRKMSSLSRVSNYMSFGKKRLLLKAFVESQFGYCSLTWMFHSRKVNSKINHIHERTLRIVHKGNISSFEELLRKDKFFCIYHRNIQSLAIELFKVKNNLSNRMCHIFEIRNLNYNYKLTNRLYKNMCQCLLFWIKCYKIPSNRNMRYCCLRY